MTILIEKKGFNPNFFLEIIPQFTQDLEERKARREYNFLPSWCQDLEDTKAREEKIRVYEDNRRAIAAEYQQ